MAALPDEAWLVALLALPGMGSARLAAVLVGRSAEEARGVVLAGATGVAPDLGRSWASAARRIEPRECWEAHQAAGVQVLVPGSEGWPPSLLDDPEPPALLFARGDIGAMARPCVAVVGTRRCTATGRSIARELGHELASVGVGVVSGLALGIDGAAHEGALAAAGAAPIAVVGSGHDHVYPRRNGVLWERLATEGLLLSEYPLGTPPERWRFPARNRILAGLVDVVVVVESHVRGGSMHTVESAMERGRTVLAVPGSVRSPASTGTNALLAAGAAPARDTADVLVALGLDTGGIERRHAVPNPTGEAGRVLEALGWEPATLEQLAERLDVPLGPVAVHLVELEGLGWLRQQSGWYERVR